MLADRRRSYVTQIGRLDPHFPFSIRGDGVDSATLKGVSKDAGDGSRTGSWSSCSHPKAAPAVRRRMLCWRDWLKSSFAGNLQLIALEEHVDYWNDLGWMEPFLFAGLDVPAICLFRHSRKR